MIAAGIATYFNSRASVARQSPEAAANPQTAMMNKLALYVFPLGVVVGGPFLPIAIILYWFSNNIWTFGQQHYVFGMIESEEEAKKLEAQERRAANAPPPGAKPNRGRKSEVAQAAATDAVTDGSATDGSATDDSSTDGSAAGKATGKATDETGSSTVKPGGGTAPGDDTAAGNTAPRPGSTPRPGARPKKRRR
jgi:YidC/Oxa1 family membrane protein insertase